MPVTVRVSPTRMSERADLSPFDAKNFVFEFVCATHAKVPELHFISTRMRAPDSEITRAPSKRTRPLFAICISSITVDLAPEVEDSAAAAAAARYTFPEEGSTTAPPPYRDVANCACAW